MDLIALHDDEVDGAFQELKSRIEVGAIVYRDFTLITPTGNEPCTAYWRPKEKFWVVLERDDERKKYWCSYGTRDPQHERAQRFLCQINVQRVGNPSQTAGGFAKDTSSGHRYYIHSGRLAVSGFAEWYQGRRADITWPSGRRSSRIVIGSLRDARFVQQLADYVKAIESFRNGSQPQPSGAYFRNAIMLGIDEAIQQAEEQAPDGTQDNSSIASIRLGRLRQVQTWLRDDPEMLQSAVDTLTSKAERDRRRRIAFSISAATVSIIAGWLLSAVRPDSVFAHLPLLAR